MSRRAKKTPDKPFDVAFQGIDHLEHNVMLSMLDRDFTHEQVVRWLYPDDMVDKLQAAYPFVREVDRGNSIHERLDLPVHHARLPLALVECQFTITTAQVRMLVPTSGHARHHEERGHAIMKAVSQAYEHHTTFEKVRRVVRWLNDFATVGAARHYCPWLTSILPPEHPFQSASGTGYREPRMSMVGIMGPMRESGAIMASALLCGEPVAKPYKVMVQFYGDRESEVYYSQPFTLL